MRHATFARAVVLGPLAILTLLFAGCTSEREVLFPDKPDVGGTTPNYTDPYGGSSLVKLCKNQGPEGNYTFHVTATGGTLLQGETVSLAVGECTFVWAATSPDAPEVQVTVQEVDLPAGVKVAYIFSRTYADWTGASIRGVDQVTISVSWDNAGEIYFHNEGAPLPEPCAKCEGGVSELTLRNDGPSGTVEVRKKGGPVLFSGWVDSGAEFSFKGADADGKMGADIEVRVDGVLNTTIHTSCSRPIGPGLVSGSFTVMAGASVKGGALCPIPPPPPPGTCGKCDGGVSELTLRNDGPAGTVEVRKKGGPVLFSGWVEAGAEFSFKGADKDGKMGADIEVRVDGVLNTTIHVSCSRPIGPGLVSGSFTVMAGASVKGGALCPIPPPPDGSCDYCSTGLKPRALTLTYTGQSCAATSHSQDPAKVQCAGDPAGADLVHITVLGGKDKVYFDGVVPLNGSFTLDAANGGEPRLHADTNVTILDGAGNVLQTIRFHTSCSQPLMEGDQFGSLQLTGFTPEG